MALKSVNPTAFETTFRPNDKQNTIGSVDYQADGEGINTPLADSPQQHSNDKFEEVKEDSVITVNAKAT